MKPYLFVIFLSCILLTACSSKKVSEIPDVKSANQAKKPSLEVELNTTGNQVTVKVNTDLAISKEHYGKERKSGEGHIHVYLDNGEKIAVTDEPPVFKDLTPGSHSLRVSLHNNDHTPYDVTKTIEFEIK